jgi:hypothetical protein
VPIEFSKFPNIRLLTGIEIGVYEYVVYYLTYEDDDKDDDDDDDNDNDNDDDNSLFYNRETYN